MKSNIYGECGDCFTADEDYGYGSLEGRKFNLVWTSNENITQETLLTYFEIEDPKDRDYYDSTVYNEALWIDFCKQHNTKVIIEIYLVAKKEKSYFGFNATTSFCLCNVFTTEYVIKGLQKDPEWTVVSDEPTEELKKTYLIFFDSNGIEATYNRKNFDQFLDYYEVSHDLVNRSARKPDEYANEIRRMFWSKNLRNLTIELKISLFNFINDKEVNDFFEYVKSV